MTKTTRSAVWTLLFLIGLPAAGRAADDQWQVGTAPSFSSGRYGTSSRTEVLHTPFNVRRVFDSGDMTIVLPFTCINGNGGVTVVNGAPVRRERLAGSDTRTDDTTLRSETAPFTQRVTNCGMGDIVVRGRFYVIDERSWIPTIALRGHVKTPTASAARGLGTGRFDEGMGLEISRTLGGGVIAMVDGGYTVIGQPAFADYNNIWWYDVGIGQDLAHGVVNVSVFFEEYRAIVPGLEDGRDILVALGLKGASGWRVQLSGQFGLSDSAPDHGFTLGASRRF